jgi:predicted nucleotidyltransferase
MKKIVLFKRKTKKERMEILSNLIKKVSERSLDDDSESIKVYYCFYDKDNEVLCDTWKHEFIYSLEDVEKL